MTPAELAEAGRTLYGDRWQTQLARDLGVSDRTVRHWIAGRSAIPRDARRKLQAIAEQRATELDNLMQHPGNPEEQAAAPSGKFGAFQHGEGDAAPPSHGGLAEAGSLPPFAPPQHGGATELYGFMRGSVIVPPGFDLTAPSVDEPFAADEGKLHQ